VRRSADLEEQDQEWGEGMKVTEEMIRAAQAAMECDPAECDECVAKGLAAVLDLIEPERVDVRVDPVGLGAILKVPLTVENFQPGSIIPMESLGVIVTRVR
jgi:hypothetical protein